MGRAFNFQRTGIAIGSLPDADPNVATPAPADVFQSPGKTEDNRPATSVQFGVDMDVAGTVDITPWMQDERSGVWFNAATELGVTDKQFFEVVGAAGMDVFFQLTNPATFATIGVHAESVP